MTKEILIISNEKDITSDFIVSKLHDRNVSFYRLNTDHIGKSVNILFELNANSFFLHDTVTAETINLSEIKAVYFRRPEVYVNSKGLSESEYQYLKTEVYYTLEGLYRILSHAFWLNNIFAIREAENKIYQQILAQKIGLRLPNSIITNDPKAALQFCSKLDNNVIIKPIRSGLVSSSTNDNDGIIFTSKLDLNPKNSERVAGCPIYLQKHIEKKADVRVTIVGQKIFSALIHSQENETSKTDWRKASFPLSYSQFKLPLPVEDKCLALMERLSLNFGALDFVLDINNDLIFLEINPNGQWAWIEKQLNYSISDEIVECLLTRSEGSSLAAIGKG